MRFSLIIVSYNAPDDLDKCLRVIRSELTQIKNTEVVIVDNKSSDKKTISILKKYQADQNFKIVFNSKNIGFGPANNQAVKSSNGDWLVFINPDTYWPAGQLKLFINLLKQQPQGVVAVGPKIISPNRSLQASAGNLPRLFNLTTWALGLDIIISTKKPYHIRNKSQYNRRFYPEWLAGTFIAIRRDIFIKAGGFPTNIFMYGEDVTLSQKLGQFGRLLYDPQVIITHRGQASSSKINSLYQEAIFILNYIKDNFSTPAFIYTKTIIILGFGLRNLIFKLTANNQLASGYQKIVKRLIQNKF